MAHTSELQLNLFGLVLHTNENQYTKTNYLQI